MRANCVEILSSRKAPMPVCICEPCPNRGMVQNRVTIMCVCGVSVHCGLVAQFLRRKGLSIQWLRKGTTTIPTRPSGTVRCVVAWHPQPRICEPCPLSPILVVAKYYDSDVYGKALRLDRQGQVALSVALSLGTPNRPFLNHAPFCRAAISHAVRGGGWCNVIHFDDEDHHNRSQGRQQEGGQ